MLTPDYLQGAPAELEELFLRLEEDIIADICRRIAKAGYLTDSAEHQVLRLRELGAGTEYIKQKISEYSALSDEAVDRLFFDAAQTSDEFYRKAYDKANIGYTPYEYNDFFQQAVTASVNQTKGELRNFTQSMGFSYRGSNGQVRFHGAAEAYRDCLDYAYMQVMTGAVDHNTAIRNATRRLTEGGLQFVDYASGVRCHADVAARRAVLTGLSQMTGKVSEHNAAELGTDIVEVDAHAGARPDHAEWQGKWYSLSGKSKKYPSLKAVTGYGTVTGLKGANCRHDFYPVIEGISEPSYTEEELKNIDPPPFEYNGKTYTYYEATQRQRAMERSMRKTKREILAADATDDKDRFTEKSVLLRRQKEEYGRFSKAAGLSVRNERAQVGGFSHSQASRSAAEYKKMLTLGNGNATIGLKVNSFRNALASGSVNTSVDTKNQPKHVNGKVWKNQVKQAVQSGGKVTPRSILAKGLDPQDLINRYAGTGDHYEFRGNNKYPDEFITLPFEAGRTYNKKTGKYEATNRVQIKYDENKGAHIFPVLMR
nr:MAG TPA: minor capsid protein [Caudoviricetes sp.]